MRTPAPAWTTRTLVAPPSRAGPLAAATFATITLTYGAALTLLGTHAGVLSPGEGLILSVFLVPAALLALAQVFAPHIGSRRLSYARTATLAASATVGTLGVAIAYAWYDITAAAASTTSEWRGLGLIFVPIPAVIGTGLGAIVASGGFMVADAASRHGTPKS